MSTPKNSCRTLPQPQNSQSGPQKVKNDPKMKQKQISELTETYKIRLAQNLKNVSNHLSPNLLSVWGSM